jgi:hypothetical protein
MLLIGGTAQESSAINLNPTQLLGSLKNEEDETTDGASESIDDLKEPESTLNNYQE